jgi:DNA ligase-1
MGYEGQMVRHNIPYEKKRSKGLLKRKEFVTQEYPVISVEEGKGNWAGYVKRVNLELEDGRNFGAGIRGSQSVLKALLSAKCPDWATVRSFAATPDGIPRFGVVIDWGYGKRED